jgi:site-specific DNA recombinase
LETEGLITPDVFELNQKRLKREDTGKRIRIDINPEFPLRGLLVCGYCNDHVTSGKTKGRSKTYPYYVCHNKDCENYGKSLKKEDVEVGFDEFLKKQKLKKEVNKVVGVIFDKAWKKEVGEFEKGSKKIWVFRKRLWNRSLSCFGKHKKAFKSLAKKGFRR